MFGVPLNNAGPAKNKRIIFCTRNGDKEGLESTSCSRARFNSAQTLGRSTKKFSNQQPSDADMPGSFELAPWKASFWRPWPGSVLSVYAGLVAACIVVRWVFWTLRSVTYAVGFEVEVAYLLKPMDHHDSMLNDVECSVRACADYAVASSYFVYTHGLVNHNIAGVAPVVKKEKLNWYFQTVTWQDCTPNNATIEQ